MVDIIYDATTKGGLFVANINLYPTKLAEAAHLMLPPTHPGEMNLTSMNGERRLRLSAKVHGSAGYRLAGLPDRRTHREHVEGDVREGGQREDGRALRRFRMEAPKRMPSMMASAGQANRASAPIDSQGGGTGNLATYERLRAAGNNGVQLPIKEYKGGKLVGTEMLYTDGKFDTADGKAEFKASPWPGLPKPIAEMKAKYRFWINNGRNNEVWQTGVSRPVRRVRARAATRWPIIEINPEDATELGIACR